MRRLTSVEICAGAGGQAIGLEQAGFEHLALVELDSHACNTLRINRPEWNVIEQDLREFKATEYPGVDLLAGGVPCQPFSKGGQQLGEQDDRNLLPEFVRIVQECKPKAIMMENVRGLLDPLFHEIRESFTHDIEIQGYKGFWKLLHASDYGVPQLRPRVIFVALQNEFADSFVWPEPALVKAPTVGEVLYEEMASNGWKLVDEWKAGANQIAPTIVGGSKKHGGPDLGPTRAKKAWEVLGVNGKSIAEEPPEPDFEGLPRLTVRMAATLQGFPTDWEFAGRKTPAYRQVGNAFPPPVARSVGESIKNALVNSLCAVAR